MADKPFWYLCGLLVGIVATLLVQALMNRLFIGQPEAREHRR